MLTAPRPASRSAALLVGVTLMFAALLGASSAVPTAEAALLSAGGYRGLSEVQATARCKYSSVGPQGTLATTAFTPAVVGADLRAGVEDITWARYRTFLVDSAGNTADATGWSGWLRASDQRGSVWTGAPATLVGAWRGSYRLETRIEWWNSSRMLGWAAHAVARYQFFDQFNSGPYGPYSRCARSKF